MSESDDADAKAWVQDASSAVEFPAKAKGAIGWYNAFRAVLSRIRDDGRNGVAATTLRTVANREEPRFEWTWAETVLPWVPGVYEERPGRWCFDPADVDREQPDPPEDPPAPSDDRIADMVEASDFPGTGTTPATHRNAVGKCTKCFSFHSNPLWYSGTSNCAPLLPKRLLTGLNRASITTRLHAV